VRSLGLVTFVFALALSACGGTRGPVLHAGEAVAEHDRGVADAETWMTLEAQHARVRVPRGWHYAKRDGALVAESPDRKAAIVLTGVTSKSELASTLRTIGTKFAIEKVLFRKQPREAKLHGIDVSIVEDGDAVCQGKPAAIALVVGDAPGRRGVVVLFAFALDDGEAHDTALIDAANSLRPA